MEEQQPSRHSELHSTSTGSHYAANAAAAAADNAAESILDIVTSGLDATAAKQARGRI